MATGKITVEKERGQFLLWEGNVGAVNSPQTLSSSIYNFDQIIIVTLANSQVFTAVIPVNAMSLGIRKTLSASTDAVSTGFTYNSTLNFTFPTETTINIESSSQNSPNWGQALRQVYGVKL